jgi:hypothetical protein
MKKRLAWFAGLYVGSALVVAAAAFTLRSLLRLIA